MPRLLPTGQTILLIFLSAIFLTVVSSGYNKQPPNCDGTFLGELYRGTCKPGEQTAGFPFPVIRDVVGTSPTGGDGRVDNNDWQRGGLNIGGFLLNTLFYAALSLGVWYIVKGLKSRV